MKIREENHQESGKPLSPFQEALELYRSSHPDISGVSALLSIASSPHTTGEVLTELSEHRYYGTRREIARNPSTPSAVLKTLARDPADEEDGVMMSAMTNPSMSPQHLSDLTTEAVERDDSWAISYLVQNPSLPPSALRDLLDFDDFFNETTVGGPLLAEAIEAHPNFIVIARELLVENGHGTAEDIEILPDYFIKQLWDTFTKD